MRSRGKRKNERKEFRKNGADRIKKYKENKEKREKITEKNI